jgi:hypothetical protein
MPCAGLNVSLTAYSGLVPMSPYTTPNAASVSAARGFHIVKAWFHGDYNIAMNQPEKAHFLERVSREMDEDLGALDLSPRDALAACCRISRARATNPGLAGQVTALGEKPNTWWTLKFGLGFEEATGERMVLVDEDLQPLSGGRANPGVRFHVWIYRNRPDVKAIVHTHAPYASALSCTSSS